jgi:sulfotransferase family protein
LPEPVLVHVGYHRTGSSWLQRNFFDETKTGFRWTGKEKDDDPVRRLITARWSEFNPEKLRRRFEYRFEKARLRELVPVVSFERLSGHPCSGGYDSAEIASRIHQVIPEGRILIVIREQESAISSNYKRYVRAGGTGSLAQFVFPPTSSNLRVPLFDFRHFEYHHLIRRYQKLFGADAVLVLPFEQFRADPRTFVTEIGRFAGRPLSDDVLDSLPYGLLMQRGLSQSEYVLLRQLNRLVRSEVNPVPLIDLDRHSGLKSFAQHRAVETVLPSALARRSEESLRRELAAIADGRYAESNRFTAELTGLDLAHYGYPV